MQTKGQITRIFFLIPLSVYYRDVLEDSAIAKCINNYFVFVRTLFDYFEVIVETGMKFMTTNGNGMGRN